ncbi:helix-turn-helix domain-containing protein [Pectinatus frisingensis]|uniref:helix-turn-helix domain-containing protein n=1 Tax=Pectinatus frisingensis TaxID=865 RepID=UPI0018C663FE|nr:helix-turn-helix transcriptional regulator [Pectinatus frisingensis]
MVNNFSMALKHLIKFSGIKISSLADFISYDVSYISKWCNGNNQPSPKHVNRINQLIASFIAKELMRQNRAYPFFNEFNISIETTLSAEDMKIRLLDELENFLNNAYYQSSPSDPSNKLCRESANLSAQTIIGRTNVKKFFNNELAPLLSSIKGKIVIYVTGDVTMALHNNSMADFLAHCQFSTTDIDIHIGCNLNKLQQKSDDFIDSFYELLNKHLQINFHVYDNKDYTNSNIILLKDYFAMQYSIHSDDSIDICTYITDKKIIKDIFERTRDKFNRSNYILEPKSDIELIRFRSFFYLNSQLLLFCAKGFEFFLPPQAFNRLLRSSANYRYSSDLQETIKNMQITWEEQFDEAHIDFFMPEANIVNYIETGSLTYGEIDYVTSPEERELQLQQLIKSMKKNPNIIIHVLTASRPQNDQDYAKLSYYSNNSTAYLKKNRSFLQKKDKTIYMIKSPLLIDKFNHFFRSLNSKANCHIFSAEDIEKTYKKNSALLHRIWEKNTPDIQSK